MRSEDSSDPDATPIDVLVPVRDPAPWIGEALYSVVDQSTRNWRLLVVMDGYSVDAERACDALPSWVALQVDVLPESSGLVATLNHGLKVSTSEFVARLDADDVCHPHRLALQHAYLKQNTDVAVLATGVRLIDGRGYPVGSRVPRRPGSVLRSLRWRNVIVHPTVMMRRALVVSAGGYAAEAQRVEDYDLWLRLAALADIHVMSDILLDYRRHEGQVTASLNIPEESLSSVGRSRLDLALAKGESPFAARLRQSLFLSEVRLRGL